MTESKFIWRFTPSRTPPRLLEAIFVQRESLLKDVLARVRESATTGNKHYVLLFGPRGIGKTHFLALLRHRVAADEELSGRLRVAWLNEDETTTSFLDLLLRIYRGLAAEYSDEFPLGVLPDGGDHGRAAALRLVQRQLLERLKDRTLLVLVENLDAVFSGLGDAGQKQWRAFMQEHPVTCLVATSQQLFSGVTRRKNPFFGFFDAEQLQPLSVTEAIELLLKIAREDGAQPLAAYLQTLEGRSRVRVLHHLAGGNHRVYIVLAELIDRESLDELVGPFEKMVDELTPYYQERLRWLAPQQRRIVELLCTQTAPVPVKVIARQLFATEQTVAAQLKRLRELGYVVRETRGRESLYELTEPLMRLSYEVKENRREPLRLIVDFLRIWYRPEQLRERLAMCASTAGQDRAHLEAALSAVGSDDPRLAAIKQDIRAGKEQGRPEEAVLALEELAHTRGTAEDWFDLAYCLDQVRRYPETLVALDRSLELDPRNAIAWSNRGKALNELGRFEEAFAACEQALALDPKVALLWNNHGWALSGLGRWEEALSSFGQALAADAEFAPAWNNRGNALSELGRHEEALANFEKSLALDPTLAAAWNNCGRTLGELGRYEEALACYDRALAIDGARFLAAFNRVGMLFCLGRFESGFPDLEAALAKHWPNSEDYAGDVPVMLEGIWRGNDEPQQRRSLADRLIGVYAGANLLAYLGDGLVSSLETWKNAARDPASLDAWRQLWLDVGRDPPELEVPLRIFDVGARNLLTSDPSVLLDLLASERAILQQALGLNEPPPESPSTVREPPQPRRADRRHC